MVSPSRGKLGDTEDLKGKYVEVGRITDHRIQKNGEGYEYLILWKDRKKGPAEWRSAFAFADTKQIQRYYKIIHSLNSLYSKKLIKKWKQKALLTCCIKVTRIV
jgi:hypothetical protein